MYMYEHVYEGVPPLASVRDGRRALKVPTFFFFFLTLKPRVEWIHEVYEPEIQARLRTAAYFCEAVVEPPSICACTRNTEQHSPLVPTSPQDGTNSGLESELVLGWQRRICLCPPGNRKSKIVDLIFSIWSTHEGWGLEHPSFRALSGRLEITVRRHQFDKTSFIGAGI